MRHPGPLPPLFFDPAPRYDRSSSRIDNRLGAFWTKVNQFNSKWGDMKLVIRKSYKLRLHVSHKYNNSTFILIPRILLLKNLEHSKLSK